jgi:antitoxin component HigA of HigAB toxin-antitoxin module
MLTRRQYDRAFSILIKLMGKDPSRNSLEGRTLCLLAELIQEYEKIKYPIVSDQEGR